LRQLPKFDNHFKSRNRARSDRRSAGHR
jgi:hypothetical protein